MAFGLDLCLRFVLAMAEDPKLVLKRQMQNIIEANDRSIEIHI